MKPSKPWPTHKGRARGKKARHRAMIRAQRAAAAASQRRSGHRRPVRDFAAEVEQYARETYDA